MTGALEQAVVPWDYGNAAKSAIGHDQPDAGQLAALSGSNVPAATAPYLLVTAPVRTSVRQQE